MGWNHRSQKPAPHIRAPESVGNFSIFRGKKVGSVFWAFQQAGGVVPNMPAHPHETVQNMLAWMFARESLRRFIHQVEAREPDGAVLHDSGFWLYVTLNGYNPQGSTFLGSDPNNVRDGYHGTSLQCLNRIVATGLEIGPAVNGPPEKPTKGIFSYGFYSLWKTTGYAHYAAIDSSGWVWAPVIYLTLPVIDPAGRKVQLGDQQVSYPDTTRLHFFCTRCRSAA